MSKKDNSYSFDDREIATIRDLWDDGKRLERIVAKTGFHSGDDAFFTRGTDDEGREVISVKGPKDNKTINMENIRGTLRSLRDYASVRVSSLVHPQIKQLQDMISMFQLVYGSPVYTDLLKIAQEVFGDVDPVIPGTVGAIFHGCFVPSSFPGEVGCDPRCAGSIPPEKGAEGWDFCPHQALIYTGNGFQALNKVDIAATGRVYINIPEGVPFTAFTPDEIQYLSNLGVREVKIIRTLKSNNEYQEQSDFLPLSSTPLSTKTYSVATPQPTFPTSTSTTSNSTAWGWGLLLGLVLLIVIIAVIFLAVRYNPRPQVVMASPVAYA